MFSLLKINAINHSIFTNVYFYDKYKLHKSFGFVVWLERDCVGE